MLVSIFCSKTHFLSQNVIINSKHGYHVTWNAFWNIHKTLDYIWNHFKLRVNVLETKPITLLLFYTILIMNPVNLLAWFTSRCQSSMIHENSHILHAWQNLIDRRTRFIWIDFRWFLMYQCIVLDRGAICLMNLYSFHPKF